VLFVENNSEERSRALLTLLDELGYTCWWHIADNFNRANYFGNPQRLLGEYHEANVLCFPKEAEVKADGMWPVEGFEDTHVKVVKRQMVAARLGPAGQNSG
jgi:hypothetical protein